MIDFKEDNIWKMVSIGAISVLVSGAGYWLVFARNVATQESVKEIIQIYSPYIQDRQLIQKSVNLTEKNSEDISHMRASIAAINTNLENLEKDVSKLVEIKEREMKLLSEVRNDLR